MNNHSFNIQFRKEYYQDAVINKDKKTSISPEFKTMYHLSLDKDYFIGDKAEVLKQVIKDLKKELKVLEEIDKKNDKARDSWDSISK